MLASIEPDLNLTGPEAQPVDRPAVERVAEHVVADIGQRGVLRHQGGVALAGEGREIGEPDAVGGRRVRDRQPFIAIARLGAGPVGIVGADARLVARPAAGIGRA